MCIRDSIRHQNYDLMITDLKMPQMNGFEMCIRDRLNTNLFMDNIQKIKLLNELMSKATPQNVDFTPHNGNYCVTLLATQRCV